MKKPIIKRLVIKEKEEKGPHRVYSIYRCLKKSKSTLNFRRSMPQLIASTVLTSVIKIQMKSPHYQIIVSSIEGDRYCAFDRLQFDEKLH